jgi:hypothetical protein
MFRRIVLMCAAVALPLSMAATTPAMAKECKADPVVQESNPYVSRTLGAFPSSLLMWRKAVVDRHGDGWQAWRRAEEKQIDCNQIEIAGKGKRWVCTRSARPCSGPLGTENNAASIAFPGKMRRGSTGEGVEALQKLLKDAGYDVEVDGNYGRGTRAAVRDFQAKEGLTVDGVVGEDTWTALTS